MNIGWIVIQKIAAGVLVTRGAIYNKLPPIVRKPPDSISVIVLQSSYVHMTTRQAVLLFDIWKADQTLLIVHFSNPGASRDLQATVKAVSETKVKLAARSEEILIDLTGAEFNGDRRGPTNSQLGAYLVCELRNDRWAFYAPHRATVYDQSDRRHNE